MKYIIPFLLLSGCAHVQYNKTGDSESLSIFSLFRTLDGLEAKRGDFEVKINKASGEVSPEQLAEAIKQIKPFF